VNKVKVGAAKKRGSGASARRTQRASRIRGSFGNSGLTQKIR